MSDAPGNKSAKELVIERASHDSDFREQLRNDAKGTIRESLGLELPDDVEVLVIDQGDESVEESESRVVLSLPPLLAEVSDSDLDSVSGGLSSWSSFRLASTRIRRISAIRFSEAFSAI